MVKSGARAQACDGSKIATKQKRERNESSEDKYTHEEKDEKEAEDDPKQNCATWYENMHNHAQTKECTKQNKKCESNCHPPLKKMNVQEMEK
jgi:hypothetical protein